MSVNTGDPSGQTQAVQMDASFQETGGDVISGICVKEIISPYTGVDKLWPGGHRRVGRLFNLVKKLY